ncbi:hypothetical protein CL634_07005 [bacterium]|nr:hypothetical protein [bacterium]
MGKSKTVVYECDMCGDKFFDPEEVFDIKDIADGNDGVLISECMVCPNCLLVELYQKRDILDPIMDMASEMEDAEMEKMEKEDEQGDSEYQKYIETLEDEEDF